MASGRTTPHKYALHEYAREKKSTILMSIYYGEPHADGSPHPAGLAEALLRVTPTTPTTAAQLSGRNRD